MNKQRAGVLALAVSILALAAFLAPAEAAGPLVLDQRVDAPDHLTVGDRFHVLITLEADPGTTVSLAPGSLPAQLSLAQSPLLSASQKGARQQLLVDLELAAFVPGDLSLPPLRLAYREAGGATGEVATRPWQLRVESVLPAGADPQPRDLKPQAEIAATTSTPVLLIAAIVFALVLLVAGFVSWRIQRERSRQRLRAVPEPPSPELGPEDRARAILDRVGVEFGASADYMAYYSVIAATVRGYLTERFGFPAFALTTRELQNAMLARGLDRWQARVVSGLLSQCDAVVFAHYRPAPERADADLTAAYEVVEMTRPLAEEPREMAAVT